MMHTHCASDKLMMNSRRTHDETHDEIHDEIHDETHDLTCLLQSISWTRSSSTLIQRCHRETSPLALFLSKVTDEARGGIWVAQC